MIAETAIKAIGASNAILLANSKQTTSTGKAATIRTQPMIFASPQVS